MVALLAVELGSLETEPCITVKGSRAGGAFAGDNKWVLWRAQSSDGYGILHANVVSSLLAHSISWSELPWQPVHIAHSSLSAGEMLAELKHTMIALREDSGEIARVLKAESLIQRFREAYRRLLAQHETTLEAINDAITIVDEDHQVLGWNWAAEAMFSIKRKEIIGQPHDKFFDLDRQWCTRVLRTGERVRQLSHVPRDGVHVIINSLPIYLDGKVVGAVSAEQDMSHFVLLQKLLLATSSRMNYLESEVGRLRQVEDPFRRIIGRSVLREELVSRVRKAAGTTATVLIRGESGVGKELVATALHEVSTRAHEPLVTINCGAVPPALFETELCGYEGGAFTGADRRGKIGRLEQANRGTLFLDEVGDLPLEMQVKLLRVLEKQEFYRVGGTSPVRVDVRFVAATNRSLEELIEKGTFREDLFYRLRVVTIEVASLRERPEDIPDLIYLFLQEFAARYRRPIRNIEPGVIHILLRHTWPGNIRELRNVVEQLVVLADDGEIRAEYLPQDLLRDHPALPPTPVSAIESASLPLAAVNNPDSESAQAPAQLSRLDEAARESDRKAIQAALKATNGNRSAAARLLGISRPTLYTKMKQLALSHALG